MSWGATVFLDRLDPPNRVFESIYLLRVITGFTQQVFFFKADTTWYRQAQKHRQPRTYLYASP